MNEGLFTSEKGQRLVESFESCLKRVGSLFTTYRCPAGVLTIGWGHTLANGRRFKEGDTWTQGECDTVLREDLAVAERAVKRRVKVELTQSQFDALVSFTFNCGAGNLKRSTLLRRVNKKDFNGAAEQFAPWNRGGGKVLRGLTRRRAAEAELFRNGNHEAVRTAYHQSKERDGDIENMPQSVDIPPGTPKPMQESKIGNGSLVIGAAGVAEAASKAKDTLDQANAIKDGVKDLGLWDQFATVATTPTFWIAIAIVVVAGAIWFWRREHAQNGV